MKSLKTFVSISPEQRAKFVANMICSAGFAYHIIFLFIFFKLKVYPMFYFNIASIVVFFTSLLLINKKNRIHEPFFLCFSEVLLHQIFADYFLGAETNFHFFILLIGIVPFLIFNKNMKKYAFISFLTTSTFIIIEFFCNQIEPKYEISQLMHFIIRCINTGLSTFLILAMIFIFTLVVHKIEQTQEHEITSQAEKLQKQNKKIIEIQNNTIISLSNLVENRDFDTGEHVRRTSAYVELIAKKAQKEGFYKNILTDNFINLLEKAAPMHDIGKIVIPDSILKKPGKLTSEEFEEIKRHTTEGGRIVHEVLGENEEPEYVNIASDVATFHHEKWDGSGYPYHKKGEDIPLSARIMAIADVYDALVSPRCYKLPMSPEEAFKIISESSGSHFDPILAELFLALRKPVEEVMNSLKD